MTWYVLNGALTLGLVFFIARAFNAAQSSRRQEVRFREAEQRIAQLLVELAKKGLR